jgi:hypothetical protein
MSEFYYMCPLSLWELWQGPKGHFEESHWVPTEEAGIIFVICKFRHKNDRWLWEKQPGVTASQGSIRSSRRPNS